MLVSPANIVSGISTILLPENPNELCDWLESLLQEKQAGYNSNIINAESVALVDKLLDHKCISTKQYKFLLPKCSE